MSVPARPAHDPWAALRRHTPARIGLGRSGISLPTEELLRFNAAHAQARDAVHVALDVAALENGLHNAGWSTLVVQSRAAHRDEYLRRPDLGRRLREADIAHVRALGASHAPDLAVMVGDGLSATAVQRHAVPTLAALRDALEGRLQWAPSIVIATQARVALADEVGQLLNARAVLILLGERPGLSSPDSLGAYLTHAPHVGCTDAQRNCVSNIRPEGLAPAQAGARIAWLLRESLRLGTSGVALKDNSQTDLIPAG